MTRLGCFQITRGIRVQAAEMSAQHYDRYFDVYQFMNTYYTDPRKRPFASRQFVQFWKNVKKTDIKFLEYGGGATMSKLATACAHVQDIVFAEYLESCRNAVQAWIDKDPKAFDWRPHFGFIVQELEGKRSDEVAQREDELRHKIRAIVPCDIRAENILDVPAHLAEKYGPPYDVVATSNCLEVVLGSEEEHKEAVKKLAKLVKPGGYLLIHGTLGETWYDIGENKFLTLPLTKEMVVESMTNAGLEDIEIILQSSDSFSKSDFNSELDLLPTDAEDMYFAHGRVQIK